MKKIMVSLSLGLMLLGSFGLTGKAFASETGYGNGVYCNKHTCHVNWGEAWSSILHNSANNLISGGNYGWH